MNRTDWVRATYVAAVVGGVYWALVVHALASAESARAVVVASAVTGVCLAVVGVLVLRTVSRVSLRAYAFGIALAPLTGLAAQLPMALIHLLRLLG